MSNKKIEQARNIFMTDTEEFFNKLDKSGKNFEKFKFFISKKTDEEFKQYILDLKNGKETISFDINEKSNTVDIPLIESVAKKYNIALEEEVIFMHNKDSEGNPIISKYKVPILHYTIMRLIQLVMKKNNRTHTADKRNPMTNTVTGEDKSASHTDVETFSNLIRDLPNTILELNGPRADDPVTKLKMLNDIASEGRSNLKDMVHKTENKQSIRWFLAQYIASGFKVELKNNDNRIIKVGD